MKELSNTTGWMRTIFLIVSIAWGIYVNIFWEGEFEISFNEGRKKAKLSRARRKARKKSIETQRALYRVQAASEGNA